MTTHAFDAHRCSRLVRVRNPDCRCSETRCAWDSNTLLALIIETNETRMCRWRDETWSCASMGATTGVVDLVREGDVMAVNADVPMNFDVETLTFTPRAEAAKDTNLQPGARIDNFELQWTVNDFAIDCFETDSSKLRPICRERGTVTELLLLENDSEVAWAHVAGHSSIVRRYGNTLFLSDSFNTTLVALP